MKIEITKEKILVNDTCIENYTVAELQSLLGDYRIPDDYGKIVYWDKLGLYALTKYFTKFYKFAIDLNRKHEVDCETVPRCNFSGELYIDGKPYNEYLQKKYKKEQYPEFKLGNFGFQVFKNADCSIVNEIWIEIPKVSPVKTEPAQKGIFTEKTLVFTGTLQRFKREEAKEIVESLGGKTSDSVSSKTSLLILGANAGSKAVKAEKLGVKTISEEEFGEMIADFHKPKTVENSFEFTDEQKGLLKMAVKDGVITSKQANLFEKLAKKHAVPCYYLVEVYGEPEALDASVGGVALLPMGKELPKSEGGMNLPLFFQLNFDGVNLPGYPDKGIFQIFMEEEEAVGALDELRRCMRYYENIPAEYRKDIECSDHMYGGSCRFNKKHYKLKLEKGWALYPFQNLSTNEDHIALFDDCKIFEQITEDSDIDEVFEFLDDYEIFPLRSNIGGYGYEPDSMVVSLPDETFIFLDSDMTIWGGDQGLSIGKDFPISTETADSELVDITIAEFLSTQTKTAANANDIENFNIVDGVLAKYLSAEKSDVVIPDGVRIIGEKAFAGKKKLKSILIPDSVTEIGESAFSNCTGLTGIVIPDGVTEIGEGAFDLCEKIESIVIPNGITYIGEKTFSFCKNLKSITIPDSVNIIGKSAFEKCESLVDINLPSSVKRIDEKAFNLCESLVGIVIPDGVTEIGESTFRSCKNLKSITIPDSVKKFANSLFDVEKDWGRDKGHEFCYCESLERIKLPYGLEVIGYCMFSRCPALTEFIIPDSVKHISANAFRDSTGIKSITIPDSVIKVDEQAFMNWVETQTIYVNREKTEKWHSKWAIACEAKIVYR